MRRINKLKIVRLLMIALLLLPTITGCIEQKEVNPERENLESNFFKKTPVECAVVDKIYYESYSSTSYTYINKVTYPYTNHHPERFEIVIHCVNAENGKYNFRKDIDFTTYGNIAIGTNLDLASYYEY